MTFTARTKLWHPELGFVLYERPFKSQPDTSYVEHKHKLVQVQTSLLSVAPPKTVSVESSTKKQQQWLNKFRKRTRDISTHAITYELAGWMASRPTRFNLSSPPHAYDQMVQVMQEYNIEADNTAFTVSTPQSQGWSCHVISDMFPKATAFEETTGVTISHYWSNRERMEIQTREFVLGILGGQLGFFLNGEWWNCKQDDPALFQEIRGRVPEEFVVDFDSGVTIGG